MRRREEQLDSYAICVQGPDLVPKPTAPEFTSAFMRIFACRINTVQIIVQTEIVADGLEFHEFEGVRSQKPPAWYRSSRHRRGPPLVRCVTQAIEDNATALGGSAGKPSGSPIAKHGESPQFCPIRGPPSATSAPNPRSRRTSSAGTGAPIRSSSSSTVRSSPPESRKGRCPTKFASVMPARVNATREPSR